VYTDSPPQNIIVVRCSCVAVIMVIEHQIQSRMLNCSYWGRNLCWGIRTDCSAKSCGYFN